MLGVSRRVSRPPCPKRLLHSRLNAHVLDGAATTFKSVFHSLKRHDATGRPVVAPRDWRPGGDLKAHLPAFALADGFTDANENLLLELVEGELAGAEGDARVTVAPPTPMR
jgi:hypothetical protein